MKSTSLPATLLLSFVCLALAGAAPTPAYLAPDSFDFKKLLGGPPADDSPEHKAEFETLHKLQGTRTPEEVRRAKREEELTVFAFADVLGPWFSEKNLPVTKALMQDVLTQTKPIHNAAKKVWSRKRPFTVDPTIIPAVALETTASYPSGHATRGVVLATLLADMFPEQSDALMKRGLQIGTDRILGGVHFPSDVEAGQKLGTEIARRLLADDTFHGELDKCKTECLAGAGH